MQRSTSRILTTHVGSLPRPAELLEAVAALNGADGGPDPDSQQAYEAILKRSVADLVRKQAEAGIDIISDGELGKVSWATYILDRISGFEIRRDRMQPLVWLGRDRDRFPEFFAREMPNAIAGAPTEVCVGPITYQGASAMQRDITNFKDALKDVKVEEAFLPVVAPASTAYNGINEYYPNEKEYVYAIADALRQEYRAIVDAGLLVQVDDAVLANMYDHLVQTSPEHY